jgi:predicted alpha/beta superfamily hydrolase
MDKPTLLHVEALDTDYHLTIHAPESGGPHPLLLVTDGDDLLAPMVAAAQELVAAHRIPPLILAGIGYGGSFRSPRNRRGRDYTPTKLAGEPMENGGAAAFLASLRSDVLPRLMADYPVDRHNLGVAGHSLGSLFGLFALFQPEPLFQRFLLSSPSIWWDDRSVLRIAAELRARQSQLPARVFLSVGEDDTPSMTGDLALLEDQLAATRWQALDYAVQRFPEHDHITVIPAAYRAGLEWLYRRQPVGRP